MEFNSKKHQFSFPHPIIKDLTREYIDQFREPPPLYAHYQSSDPSIPSSKILRTNYKWPIVGKQNIIVLQPFHPGFIAPETAFIHRCQKCDALMNPFTETKSTCEYECNLCGKVQKYDFTQIQNCTKNAVMDFTQKKRQTTQIKQKTNLKQTAGSTTANSPQILLVLQLNEYAYNFKIHQAIINFVEGLQNQKVGFLLFNQTFLYSICLCEKEIRKNFIDCKQLIQLPIPIQKIMASAKSNQVKWAIQQVIPQLMFQSFFMKKSCLFSIQRMLSSILKNIQNIQVKFVINSLDRSYDQQDKQNYDSEQLKSERFQFFVINQNMTFKQIMQTNFANQIERIYDKKNFNKDDLYYDLFHSFHRPLYNNVEIIIRSSGSIVPDSSKRLFNRITSECPIVVQYTFNKKIKLTERCQVIQFEIKFGNKRRVITYPISQIILYQNQKPQYFHTIINDQVYFYLIMRKIISKAESKKQHFELIREAKALISNQKQGHYINRNMRCLFFYCYSMLSSPLMERQSDRFSYERHLFLNQNLQTFVKKIYPRTYQIYPQLANIKSVGTKLDTHQIYLVQNGSILFLVVGEDCPVQKLKQNFGEWNIANIIHLRELPDLETNLKLRNSIQFIRSRNQIYFLPLKIVAMDSNQFQQEIGRYLYVAEDHRKFLQILFQQKSTPKKPVRY